MKNISYKAVIGEVGTDRIWKEEFSDLVTDDTTILRHCQFLIERFNDTLRPKERPRKVISVRPTQKTFYREHNWNKMTWNPDEEGCHTYQCAACGATGKRYGLAKFVTPNRKFTIYCK